MNDSLSCLTPERLRQLSENELTPPQLAELEEHVTHCESCRFAMEQAAAEPEWRQEVRAALADESGPQCWSGLADSSLEDEPHDACAAVEQFRRLLGPTDDPRMLGRIGTYEIIGILGRGGMGVVFKGFDGALNRYVAIKMLLPHLAASGAARKRFAREAQAAAAVVHDHVMAIHSVAEWQGVPYLVMPYGRGVSLQKRLNDKGSLEVREILRIGMQTAAGLAAAHAQGLVHRDVKPANILLAEDVERVTLTDFGLARAVDDASLTKSGALAGTPQYMSPEQAHGKVVDARSDLFCLGSVLYAMCTGRPPFRADSSLGVLRLISDNEPTPVREINPEIPEWLCAIVSRLMAKRPDDRFSSASEVAELLESCLAHVQQPTAVALPSSLSQPKAVPVSRRRNNLFTGVLIMVATLVLGLVAMFAWQGESPQNTSDDSLDGVWEVVLEPDTVEPPEDQRHRFVFAGEWYATFRGAERISAFRFKIDPEHTPKRISLVDGEGKPMRGIYEVQGGGLRLNLALETDALPTKFGPDLKRAKGNLAQAQVAALKLYSAKATQNKATDAKGTPQYVRQVPRHKLIVTCFNGEVDSKSNCSTKCFGEDGVPNQSGKMTCGFPGKVAEIEWKFLGYSAENDVYEFTVVAPRGSPDANTTKSDVKFDGRRTPAFKDSNHVIVLDSPETKAQAPLPDQPAEPQPKATNAAPDAGVDMLEGVWESTFPPDESEKGPEDQRYRLVFTAGWHATIRGLERSSASRFKVEPQHTPKRISFGDGEANAMRGIYEINGDGLRLSRALDTEPLPTKFRTERPTFKRVKGKLAQEQLDALKQYSKQAKTIDAKQEAELPKTRPHAELGNENNSAAATPQAERTINPQLGTLSGRFVYDGEPPTQTDLLPSFAKIDVSQPQQPGPDVRLNGVEAVYRDFLKHKIRPKTEDASLLVSKDGGIANVVVWVVNKDIPWSPPNGEQTPVMIRLKDGNFSPRFAAVTVGQSLSIENHDPLSLDFAVEFSRARNPSMNMILPPGNDNPAQCVTLRASEPYPATYRSNQALWASGRVFVHGNPFVAVSQPDGSFTLPNLPTGDWEFQVWHERGGFLQQWPKGRFQQSIKPGDNKLGTIKLKPEHLGQKPAQVIATTPPPKNREQIGEVLGKPVYRDEVKDDTLNGIFLNPVLAKYRGAHSAAISPKEDEVNFATEFFDKELRKRLDAAGGEAKVREQMKALEERLAHTDLTEDDEKKLELEHLVLRLKLRSPGRFFAEFMLNNWKFQKHLYDEFGGGRILFQQGGLEAFDATRTCLESLEKQGEFKITDAKLRAKLYEYWTRSHGFFLTDDKERIRKEFLEPEWIAPAAAKVPAKAKEPAKDATDAGASNAIPKKAVAIDPNGEIVGRLVDAATGKPVEGATIACGAVINDSLKGGGANAVTDAEGRYRLPVPSPGIYNVWLKEFDKDPSMTAAADDGLLVEPSKVATSHLLLVKGSKVVGKVVDADDKPFANINVHCNSTAWPQSATTKDDGSFEFVLPLGRARLYINELVARSKDNPFGLGRYIDAPLEVSANEEGSPIELILRTRESKLGDPAWLMRSTPGTQIVRHEHAADVTGTVLDVSGKPISGAKVFREDGPINTSDDKGPFKVSIDKGTQFVMRAFAPGYHVWFELRQRAMC